MSERLASVVNGAFNYKATEITLGDLGIVARIDEATKTDKNEAHASIYAEQRDVFETLKDLTVADFQQAVQWFAQGANAHAEKAASTLGLDDCFTSLKPKTDEPKTTEGNETAESEVSNSKEGSIESPYSDGGTIAGEGSGDQKAS